MKGERELTITRGATKFEVAHGLHVLPGGDGNGNAAVTVGVESVFVAPLYWSLPKAFLGDRISSYNGLLRFRTTGNGRRPFAPDVLAEFPLVQLQGKGVAVLEHFPRKVINSGRYEVR